MLILVEYFYNVTLSNTALQSSCICCKYVPGKMWSLKPQTELKVKIRFSRDVFSRLKYQA